MNVYVINIILTFIYALIFLSFKPAKRKKKAFCILVTINWILISGLRSLDVGADTRSYRIRFFNTMASSWKSLFEKFYVVYINDEGKDPGYSVFEKIVQLFTDNYQIYLIVVAMAFFVGMAVWIYKYSEEPCMSFLVFSSFLFGFYAITGIRQTIATVLAVFIGTKLIKENKLFKFLIVMLVAFTIHKSVLCFLPFYFVSKIKISRKYITAILFSTALLFVFKEQFFKLIGYIAGYEYEDIENRGAYGFTFLYLAVVFIMLVLLNRIKKTCCNYQLYYNAAFMGLLMLPLVFVNPTAMRVVQYYSIFLMLSVPAIINSFDKKMKPVVYSLAAFALLISSNVYSYEYSFFWQ